MTKADLLRIDGIGEPTAAKLVADGITTKSEIRTAGGFILDERSHQPLSESRASVSASPDADQSDG